MAAINWIAGSGSWTTASDWSPATVPGSSDDAVINASALIPSRSAYHYGQLDRDQRFGRNVIGP